MLETMMLKHWIFGVIPHFNKNASSFAGWWLTYPSEK